MIIKRVENKIGTPVGIGTCVDVEFTEGNLSKHVCFVCAHS